MNENNINNDNNTRYKATSNLNTAIENPQINVNNATDVNVQNLGYNNYVSQNDDTSNDLSNNNYSISNTNDIPTTNSSDINSDNNNDSKINNDDTITDTNYSATNSNDNNYLYEPTLEEKKIDNENIISNLFHSREFKALIFILFILCLFLLLMPYIYDFIKDIKLMR